MKNYVMNGGNIMTRIRMTKAVDRINRDIYMTIIRNVQKNRMTIAQDNIL